MTCRRLSTVSAHFTLKKKKDITGFGESDRGVGFAFGPDIVRDFLERNDLQLVCRAHQVHLMLGAEER